MPIARSQKEFDAFKKFERTVSEKEAKKFSSDAHGRLVVPEKYRPPTGFRGNVITRESRMEISYFGLRIIKKFGKKRTIAQ